uniref:Solute carrier family 25 member 44 n=1 Tax=Plectus sambesii TaxID=2011161 RepID=A0A914ULW5_9BILA
MASASSFDLENMPELRVIEWQHLNLSMFYPTALFSTWSVRTMLYPLAVVRSRLQLQKQHTVYRSTWHAFRSIAKHEGFRGLYKGFWVTFPQIGTSLIYTTVYERLRTFLQTDMGYSSVPFISSMAGGAAAMCSQVIFVPTDIIAQHMMIYNYADAFVGSNKSASVVHYMRSDGLLHKRTLGLRVIRAVYKVDGLYGFYRGFIASSFVYVPSCLVFWPVYYWVQDGMKRFRKEDAVLLVDQGVAAGLGGIASSIATNPFEMFRIRIQVHRTTYRDTLALMMNEEGLHVFTKGLWPRIVSNSIYSCIVMIGYELVKRACVLPEFKDAVKW